MCWCDPSVRTPSCGPMCVPKQKPLELKNLIQGDVVFQYYRDGNLWYKTCCGSMIFPVPIEDIGNATFKCVDKGILFMRYIRKQLIVIACGGRRAE